MSTTNRRAIIRVSVSLLVLVLFLACLLPSLEPACAESAKPQADKKSEYAKYNDLKHYDPLFIKYSKRYFGPDFDWRYFKAQAIAESNLDPEAQSSRGARGLMQIMPATYTEIKKKHSYIKGPAKDVRWNIAAGIWYDYQMWKKWKPKRTLEDRIAFMLGSYNAGHGNILKAQRRALKQGLPHDVWESIEAALPDVTGHRSKQTIMYVNRIEEIVAVLE